jgi:GT2 family glycosyltransferase
MPATFVSRNPSSILAVAVLYKCALEQSPSIGSLVNILKKNPVWANRFSLVIYDNSPQLQMHSIEADFPVRYISDTSNGGLAPAYNFALKEADSQGFKWLLLLDQDTSLTDEFIAELLAAADALVDQTQVGSIVPKLKVHQEIHSPAANFLQLLRRQFLPRSRGMSESLVGVQQRHLCSYNSGSTLRVSALKAIGGFPPIFWLDYLDHAIFHLLYRNGYRTYVMRATLAHDFSHSSIETVPLWRARNALAAQTLYVKDFGNFIDVQLYRIWLLRHARMLWRSCKDPRRWRETASQALRLKTGHRPGSVAPTG